MTYVINWDDEYDDILWIHLTGDVQWSEYNEMMDAIAERISSVERKVYFILVAEAPQPPGNPLPHFRRSVNIFNHLPNLQLAISVDAGMATFLRICLDVIVKINSPNWTNKLPFVRTVDEAMKLIEKHRDEQVKRV